VNNNKLSKLSKYTLGGAIFLSTTFAPSIAYGNSTQIYQDGFLERKIENDIKDVFFPSISGSNVSDVVKNTSESVVSISTTTKKNVAFNQAADTKSAGSGVIYAETNEVIYILTNNHVIAGANTVTISLDKDEKIPAHYVGGDHNSDLAIIYIDKSKIKDIEMSKYKIAKFGDSSNIEVGETVIAIGNALGEGKSATMGIISATNKNINIEGISLNVIQTDAAINPGNSGGALVNTKSEVVGINTAKLSSSGIEGMGYSIPSNEAKLIAEKIINKEYADKVYLGIQALNIDEEMKEIYNLPSIGIYVDDVLENSSAKKAKLESGDIIVGFNGQKVSEIKELTELIAKSKPGETIKVYIFRNSKTPITLEITMEIMEDNTSF
jgi:serine protease Do